MFYGDGPEDFDFERSDEYERETAYINSGVGYSRSYDNSQYAASIDYTIKRQTDSAILVSGVFRKARYGQPLELWFPKKSVKEKDGVLLVYGWFWESYLKNLGDNKRTENVNV